MGDKSPPLNHKFLYFIPCVPEVQSARRKHSDNLFFKYLWLAATVIAAVSHVADPQKLQPSMSTLHQRKWKCRVFEN